VTLNYQLTLDDWLEAARSLREGGKRWTFRVFMLLYSCFTAFFFFTTRDAGMRNICAAGLAFSAFFAFCDLFLIRFVWRNALKNNPDTTQPVTVEVNGDELHFQRQNTDTRVSWEKYTRFRETPNLFVLHWSPKVFQLVPKRAFANETDLEQFRAWASGIGQKDAPPIAPIPQP